MRILSGFSGQVPENQIKEGVCPRFSNAGFCALHIDRLWYNCFDVLFYEEEAMKKLFVINALYNQAADKAFVSILNGLSNDEREQDRGSYYKSLSGLAVHILGGTIHFLGMFKDAVAQNDAASKALAALQAISLPKGPLSEAQWKQLAADIEAADIAHVNFAKALTDADLQSPVKVAWFKGNPDSVPLFFMLNQATSHGTHHRGQISQMLDAMKIDNNYSGMDVAFLST
jgi:uncharacterized damage-inducible protein DinB